MKQLTRAIMVQTVCARTVGQKRLAKGAYSPIFKFLHLPNLALLRTEVYLVKRAYIPAPTSAEVNERIKYAFR